MKGVILAAGLGTRMRPLTYQRPKPLVPVLDRPMIEHIVLGAADAGVTELLLVVGYRAEMIRDVLGGGERFGLAIHYQVQERQSGTADAARLAEEFVAGEPFFLSWGDIIVSRRNYARVRAAWDEHHPDLLLTVNVVDDPWRGAAVYVDDGRVVRIIEKPEKGTSTTNYNNAGIFILPAEILQVAKTVVPSKRGERELPDAIQALLVDGAHVRALPIEGCWSDVADPRAVIGLNGALLAEAEYPSQSIRAASARTLDGVLAIPPFVLGEGTAVEEGVRMGPGAYIMSGATVGAGSHLQHCLVMANARVGEGCALEWAVVEEGMELSPGERIAGTPDEPACLVEDRGE